MSANGGLNQLAGQGGLGVLGLLGQGTGLFGKDPRKEMLGALGKEGGRAATMANQRAAGIANARGLTGGVAASFQQGAAQNVANQFELQRAQLQNQFANQDVQGLSQIAGLIASIAGAPATGGLSLAGATPTVMQLIQGLQGGGQQAPQGPGAEQVVQQALGQQSGSLAGQIASRKPGAQSLQPKAQQQVDPQIAQQFQSMSDGDLDMLVNELARLLFSLGGGK